MVDDRTGYVRLSRFARTTHRELIDALKTLDGEGMDRLVLDLRGNAGGLMSMAEKVADEFLVDGQLIVTARSRHGEFGSVRHATEDGRFQQDPLIVLVDRHSASASEIVAGALQDHDRALLVGERTFGKGLVQRQFALRDNSGLRLTVARFYTPSGRLLQRTDRATSDSLRRAGSDRSQPIDQVPDSLIHHTDAGRTVIGGGGIQPDELVTDESRNDYRRSAEREGLIRSFSRRWMDAHADSLRSRWTGRREAFAEQFQLPTTVYPAFVRYAAEQGLRATEGASVRSREQAKRGNEHLQKEVTSTRLSENVREARAGIEMLIKSYVGQRLYGPSMLLRVRNTKDPVLVQAMGLWPTAERWAERYPIE
jgi:carboxyl-terminal processing protease